MDICDQLTKAAGEAATGMDRADHFEVCITAREEILDLREDHAAMRIFLEAALESMTPLARTAALSVLHRLKRRVDEEGHPLAGHSGLSRRPGKPSAMARP